ncbi:hydrolase [Bacillus sp. KH172YL63]|uniref:hydrolase n=1 Tax=Bacillus sp. KH172YL63 TaxID=2709784 RepID=UPI001E4925B6|nr:hydrolase [Bacillus sp. KH172YL63]
MHSIIAYQLAAKFRCENKASFVIGGIAPDAVTYKDRSHFYTGDVEDHSREIDYEGFRGKYASRQHTPFITGYAAHLIADDLWLQGFYLPWLKNRLTADPSLHEAYHRDFRRLNAQLIHHYNLKEEFTHLLREVFDYVEIEEVSRVELEEFLPLLRGDLDYDPIDIQQPLSVFTLPQIIGYMETSIEIAGQKLRIGV